MHIILSTAKFFRMLFFHNKKVDNECFPNQHKIHLWKAFSTNEADFVDKIKWFSPDIFLDIGLEQVRSSNIRPAQLFYFRAHDF